MTYSLVTRVTSREVDRVMSYLWASLSMSACFTHESASRKGMIPA